MPYYTFDAPDDNFIAENAEIEWTDNLDDVAIEFNVNSDADFEVVGWKQAHASDAWVKFYHKPESNVIDGIKCDIRTQDNNSYWCDPIEPVFIPIYEAKI